MKQMIDMKNGEIHKLHQEIDDIRNNNFEESENLKSEIERLRTIVNE